MRIERCRRLHCRLRHSRRPPPPLTPSHPYPPFVSHHDAARRQIFAYPIEINESPGMRLSPAVESHVVINRPCVNDVLSVHRIRRPDDAPQQRRPSVDVMLPPRGASRVPRIVAAVVVILLRDVISCDIVIAIWATRRRDSIPHIESRQGGSLLSSSSSMMAHALLSMCLDSPGSLKREFASSNTSSSSSQSFPPPSSPPSRSPRLSWLSRTSSSSRVLSIATPSSPLPFSSIDAPFSLSWLSFLSSSIDDSAIARHQTVYPSRPHRLTRHL